MNALTLYGISAEMTALLNAIEEQGGEITPEQEQALSITEEQFSEKAVDYGHVILNLDQTVEAIKNEIDRLTKLKRTAENAQKRVKGSLVGAMVQLDHPTVETPTMRLSLRHSTATEVDDLDQLPAEYKTTKVEVVADKTAIKKAIQEGEDVPGAHLVENVSLQIK